MQVGPHRRGSIVSSGSHGQSKGGLQEKAIVQFARCRTNDLMERMIATSEVREIIERGELIEEYADDPRGPSCLIFGKTRQGRILHVVCAPKNDHLLVVTAYIPSLNEWERDYRTRRRGGGRV